MTATIPTRHLALVASAHVERARKVVSLDEYRTKRREAYHDDVTLDEHASTWSAILGRIVEPHEAQRLGTPTFPGGAA